MVVAQLRGVKFITRPDGIVEPKRERDGGKPLKDVVNGLGFIGVGDYLATLNRQKKKLLQNLRKD